MYYYLAMCGNCLQRKEGYKKNPMDKTKCLHCEVEK